MSDFTVRYFPPVFGLAALIACSAIWLGVHRYRRRKSERDPYKSKARQAVKFGWSKTVEVPEDGFGASWTQRSIRFIRRGEEAVLWHKDATITLVRVDAPFNFDDFFELEKWLEKQTETETDAGDELNYIRKIELFAVRHGHYYAFLEARAFDQAFFAGFCSLYEAGYASGEGPEFIAGLILESLMIYPKDKDKALRFLEGFTSSVAHAAKQG